MTYLYTVDRPSKFTAMRRGFMHRCPRCGEGHLFRALLKLADRCDHCSETLGDIRADDIPAYLTILVVGHLTVPFMLLGVRFDVADWIVMTGGIGAMLALTAVLLPSLKGMVAGLLWSLGMRSGAPDIAYEDG